MPQKRKRDLSVNKIPISAAADWNDIDTTLLKLFQRAEDHGLEVYDWYMSDKRARKRASQLLRAASILLAAAGGAIPLLGLTLGNEAILPWGYLLLATAAASVAFDKFFGLSASWMRDIAGAQATSRRLSEFQYEWARFTALEVHGGGQRAETGIRILALFAADLHQIVSDETATWTAEVNKQIGELRKEVANGEIPKLKPFDQ